MSNIWLSLICILCIKDSSCGTNTDFDYCSLHCPNKHNKHIVCIRKEKCGLSSQCESNVIAMPMTESARHHLLNRHNLLRSKVAVGLEIRDNVRIAANMRAFSYSRNLEYVAECFLNYCSSDRVDDCPITKQFSERVVQNVLDMNMDDKSYDLDGEEFFYDVVDTWYIPVASDVLLNIDSKIDFYRYNRLEYFAPTTIQKFESDTVQGKHIGMASQVLWATTTHIGCARVGRVVGVETLKVTIACNYGPGGNIVGDPIYLRGPYCSKCGFEICNHEYPGLCGKIGSSSQNTGGRISIVGWVLFGLALIYNSE